MCRTRAQKINIFIIVAQLNLIKFIYSVFQMIDLFIFSPFSRRSVQFLSIIYFMLWFTNFVYIFFFISDLLSIGSSDSRNYEMTDMHGVKSMCYQNVLSSTGGGKMGSVAAAAPLKSATATVVAGYPASDTEMFPSDYPSHHLHHHHPHQHHYSNNNNNNNNHLNHLYHNHHHQMLQPIPQTSAASHS